MSITFNGTLSDDLGVIVERIPNPQIAARRGTTEVVPGRNGVLLQDDGSYATTNATYEMHISAEGGKLYKRAREAAAWLLSKPGFLRLEDSYEPDVFRLARYNGGVDITSYFLNHGRFLASFECQPQRFLKSGEMVFTLDGGSDNYNIRITNLPSWVKKVSLDYAVGMEGSNTLRLENVNDPSDSIRASEETISGYYVQTLDVTDVYRVVTVSGLIRSPQKSISFFDEDGNQTVVLVKNGGNNAFMLYNPTAFPAQPLIEILDKAGAPSDRQLTNVPNTYITGGGNVINYSDGGVYTTQPTSVPTNGYVYVTGEGYTFLDSAGATPPAAQYAYGKPISFARGHFVNQKVPVPAGADTLVIMGTNETPAALSVQSDRTQSGSFAITVGSTSVSADLSQQDDVILDCDLHDAYFIDGSNANAFITFSDQTTAYPTFPTLGSGATAVMISANPTIAVRITPRWWAL